MALWKETNTVRKDTPGAAVAEPTAPRLELNSTPEAPAVREAPPRAASRDTTESIIGANLTIEGKIEGTGHVRVAGRFKGDIVVEGNLTIDNGAKVEGGVTGNAITIAGELEGNILNAARVELLASGVLIGDLKADTLTVAAGSRMRGRADFGWGPSKGGKSGENSTK